MNPGYPADAVRPPRWRPVTDHYGDDGYRFRVHSKSPLARFRLWAAFARSHIRREGVAYAEGYAAAWTIHGDH